VPHRVLLVDDSQTARSFAAAALESEGDLEVTMAKSGFDALRILPRGDFDLVITDINMPDINGLELIRFARGHVRYARTPLLIISTEGRDVDREKAMALGADEYLVKPFTPEALVAAVRRYLPAGRGRER
jgi:two-component system chemotaxis response regulator CheY